jgi:hypothetical protein
MEQFANIDRRLKHAEINQSLQPFSKKTPFRKGISVYFKNTKKDPDAMAKSTMSGGGLEAQRTPDLLFWFLFAIGTQGKIVPNIDITKDGKTYNPTKVILRCIVAILEACWVVRMKIVPFDFHGLLKMQQVMNTAYVCLQELFSMKNWYLCAPTAMASLKGHASCHIPPQMAENGPAIHNDCDIGESNHVKDKELYKRTSKRTDDVHMEILKMVSI